MRVFAFLDVDHPPVAWAAMRGVLVSVDRAPGPTRSFASFMMAGLIQHQSNWRLNNETIVEYVRTLRFDKKVSRLRGVYFFEDRGQAQKAIDQKWGGHFELSNLVELELYPQGEVTRVDANWITEAPRSPDGRLDTTDLTWIDKYWKGETKSDDPTWEIVASGEATVLTTAARKKAYEVVKREFPKSWEFIEMSRLASEVGSHGGLIVPLLQSLGNGSLRLSYILFDEAFKDKAVVEKMSKHPDFPRLAAHARKNIESDLIAPDFRPWWQDFKLGIQGPIEASFVINSIHITD
jgi:hypothetical protein